MRGRAITQEQYNAVKAMKMSGVKTSDIASILKIGKSTVTTLMHYDSLEDYHTLHGKGKKPKFLYEPEPKQQLTTEYAEENTAQTPESLTAQALKEISDIIEIIDARLDGFNARIHKLEEADAKKRRALWR